MIHVVISAIVKGNCIKFDNNRDKTSKDTPIFVKMDQWGDLVKVYEMV